MKKKRPRRKNSMIILGLGGLQSGGACAVLKDGTIVAAIEESKLSRTPRPGVPEAAVAECLRLAGVSRDAIDCVAVVRPVDPSLHFSLRELFPRAEVALPIQQKPGGTVSPWPLRRAC